MTPLIGISSRISIDSQWAPPITGVRAPYIDAIVAAGGAPALIPLIDNTEALRRIYEATDGILLPGGEDIDPREYGEEPHPKLGSVCRIRDQVELQLVRWAVADGKPVMGICRGLQVLNVALGGTLFQDIDDQRGSESAHERSGKHEHWFELPHTITIESGSRLATLLGTTALLTNSLHHQAIKDLAPSLRVVATSPDGVVEGVEAADADSFVLGVQCHPEMLWQDSDTRWRGVFNGFIEAARLVSALRAS